jgi:ribosomal protein L4
MKRGALRSALADKVLNDAVFVLDGFSESKTKAAAAALATAGIDGKVLIVLDPAEDGSRVVDRAFRNLRNVAFSLYGSVGTYDVVAADAVVFTPGAFDGFTNPKPVAQEEEPELQLESGGER